ncbi:hypothetical protein VTO73DRAFT_11161 [Trametes versicolor]
MLPASQRDVSEPGDPGEYTQGGETQPPDTQFKHSDFLIYAYNIANNPERPQDTQASALITALLDHAKLAARVAWELNKYDGNIDQAGFERVRRDLGGSCAILEGALVDSLAEFSPLSTPASDKDGSEDTEARILPSTMQDTLELNLCLTHLPRLRDSLVADLPGLLLADLENALMPRLLAKLEPALIDALTPPARTANVHDYGTMGRYSCATTNLRTTTDMSALCAHRDPPAPRANTHPPTPRANTDPPAPRANIDTTAPVPRAHTHATAPPPRARLDAATPMSRAHTYATATPPRAHFSESPMDNRRYVDDPLMALSGFVWDGSLPRDSDTRSHSTSAMHQRSASEGMGAEMAPESSDGQDTRGKRRRSNR